MRFVLGPVLAAVMAVPSFAEVFEISPGPEAEEALQEALILAEAGDEVRLAAGRYEIRNQLSLANDDVTLMGAGMDASVLSFAGQTGGAEGILITGDGAILKDFAVEDTKGDAIKSKGVEGIAMIRVRTEWTRGPHPENGAYGLYPVQSKNVLIDGAVAIGASDAGIYVGQSTNVIARNSRAEFNVAGLEIENCYYADVYGNELTNNTGGILVFDLPDLPQQGGHHVRVFGNRSHGNNTKNFAPEGNIVGIVPAGTGMLVMANTDVEVFDNDFEGNQTVNLIFGAYVEETEDENYQMYPRRVHIHGNRFKGGGEAPDDSLFGEILEDALGPHLPDIVWDGVMPLGRYVTLRGMAEENRHSIHSNEFEDEALAFANADFIGWFGAPFKHRVYRDGGALNTKLEPLKEVKVVIRGRDVSDAAQWAE